MEGTLKFRYAKKLKSSVLTLKDAEILGFKLVSAEEALDLGTNFEKRGGFLIQYYDILKKPVKDFFRFRYLDDAVGWAAHSAKPRRYVQPKDTGVHAYFPTNINWKNVLSTNNTIAITEGELKAASACKHGVPCIGLGGVWSFRSKTADFLPEMDAINWVDRGVTIIFDNDILDKPQVRIAMITLANELQQRGALVFQSRIPPGESKGLDDFILAYGKQAFLSMVNDSEIIVTSSTALLDMNKDVAYVEDTGCIVKLDDGLRLTPEKFWHSRWGTLTHIEESVGMDKNGNERTIEKTVETAKVWLKWDHRRSLRRFTFAPGEESVTEDGSYNMWTGWGVEPKRITNASQMKPWHDFMTLIFGKTKEGKDARAWFERWVAFPIQHPGAKMYTACLFYSINHGTGKTFLGEIIRKIYGVHSSTPEHDDLLGQWNTWRAAVQFVLADEVAGGAIRIPATKLKGLITSESFRLRQKYAAEIQLPDCSNFFFTSNYPDAVRIEHSDRRFFVWEVIEKASPEFFKRLDTWYRGDGCAYLFEYMRRLPINGFDPKTAAMYTEAKHTMSLLSASDLASWIAAARVDAKAFCAHCDLDLVEVLPIDQMRNCYLAEGGKKISMRAMRVCCQEQGLSVRSVKPKGEEHKVELVALGNNQEHWKNCSDKAWIEALDKSGFTSKPALAKF